MRRNATTKQRGSSLSFKIGLLSRKLSPPAKTASRQQLGHGPVKMACVPT